MSPPLRDDERYDPLPGLLQIPALLLRQLWPRGRRWAIALAVATAVASVTAAVVLAPEIRDTKRRAAAADDARRARLKAERLARLRAEVKPRRGSAPELAVSGAAAPDALRRRRALVRELERAVLVDARGRIEAGKLRLPVRRAVCEQFPRRASGSPPEERLSARSGRYECLAVTSRIAGREPGSRGLIGYPYRARADFRTGGYAWCKISGRAGEGGLRGQPEVKVPRVCGGD